MVVPRAPHRIPKQDELARVLAYAIQAREVDRVVSVVGKNGRIQSAVELDAFDASVASYRIAGISFEQMYFRSEIELDRVVKVEACE